VLLALNPGEAGAANDGAGQAASQEAVPQEQVAAVFPLDENFPVAASFVTETPFDSDDGVQDWLAAED
jgi:hypothetical protein